MEYRSSYKPMVVWILIVMAMVYAMVIVGGLTRLTNSGLSMVDWKPIVGAIPPLSEQDWLHVFEKYKQYPEYQKINHGISLDQFKNIFYWEYGHRVLGRLIGIVFFVPYIYFLIRKKVRGSLSRHLFVAFILGGAQGLLGWYMVKSGLVDQPKVSQYRLAAHLGLAFFLLSYLHWVFLGMAIRSRLRVGEPSFRALSWTFLFIVALQIFYGALTAGLDAGLMYNTFPSMNGLVAPPGMFSLQPMWSNFFENPVLVQFIHRCLGWSVLAAALLYLGLGIRYRAEGIQRVIQICLALAVLGQFALGVGTLLLQVPISLASLHQAGAGILLLLAVTNVYIEQKVLKDRTGV